MKKKYWVSVGVSALMKRCELLGLYFQTKFFSNHSQLFSWWSTLRCYVKTLRKDQRIINWKSLDRISTCHLKCMWPRLSPPHILRHSEVRSPVLYLLEHFLGDSNNRIWYSDNQSWSLSRARAGVRLSHVSFSFPHRHWQSGPREGTEFKFKSPLWPSHQLPLTLFEFQCNDASPFFSLPGLPPSDGGTLWPGPPGGWWPSPGPPVVTIVWPALLVTSPGPDITHNTHRVTQRISTLNVCSVHLLTWKMVCK